MKRNSQSKQKAAKLGSTATPVAASRSDKPVPKSKGRVVRDKVIDGAISMSDGFLDYYQFIKDLSEQFEFGFTTQEMVSLTYEGTTSPWPETRKCSCTASKEQVPRNENKFDNGSSQTPCPNCQASSKVAKETQPKKSPVSVTTPGPLISSSCTVICPDCNRAQCNHPRRPGTSGGRKTNSPPSAKKSVNSSRTTSLPKSKSRTPIASIACTCSMPSSQKTPSLASLGSQTRRSPEALKASPTKIVDGSELECSHLEFLPCKPDTSLVGPSSVSAKGPVVRAPKLNYLSGLPSFRPQKEETCTTLNPSDSHARCCRVIRLSQREHLLLRRFDKAKNWCEKLNKVLSDRGMRIFLLHQAWEIHVKGVLNFDHTRRKILMAIRSAVVKWDEQRKARPSPLSRSSDIQTEAQLENAIAVPRETDMERGEDNQTPSEPNQGTDPPSIPADVICTAVADSSLTQQPAGVTEASRSVRVQNAEPASAENSFTAVPVDEAENNNADAEVQPLIFKCEAFPYCQLRTASLEQSCHRIFFDHEDHQRLLHFEDTLQMTEKLNDVLKQQNLSIQLLKRTPEFHISGGGHIRGKLWRIVWGAAVDAGLHRALISLSRSMEAVETEDTPELDTSDEVDENEPNPDSEEEDSPASPSTVVYLGERSFTCTEETGQSVITIVRPRPVTPNSQVSRLRCKDYPECTNLQDTGRPRCHVIPINPNDGSHANLLEWNRLDQFVRKLNEHLEDLKLQVSLLTSKPEFHVYGQSPATAVPMLTHVTTGLRGREDIKENLLFLYPGYARKIGRGWKRGNRGVCKCHGVVTMGGSQARYRGAKYTIKAPFLREAQPY